MADGRLRPARLNPPRWNCTRPAHGRRPHGKVTDVSAACKSEHAEGLNDFIVMAKRATYAAGRYLDTNAGDLGRFTGEQWIEHEGRRVYELRHFGGLIRY